MKLHQHLCSFILLTLTASFDFAQAVDSKERLLRNALFSNYSKLVWPSVDDKGGQGLVNVTIAASLRQFLELDEKSQTLLCKVWLTLKWTDSSLTWNPENYGNIESISMTADSIWTPDIMLINDVREKAMDPLKVTADINSKGLVDWEYPVLYRSSCDVQVAQYPFDSQVCPLQFRSWTNGNGDLALNNATPSGDTSNYLNDSQWYLVAFLVRKTAGPMIQNSSTDVITFHIVVKRMPLYYIFNLLIPCLVIVLLGYTGFLLPASSGEKISMFITTLLALTVFLLMVADQLPAQSESIPLISQFFGSCIILLALSCVAAVIVMNVHFRGFVSSDFPPWAYSVISNPIIQMLFLPSGSMDKMNYIEHLCRETSISTDESNTGQNNDDVDTSVQPKDNTIQQESLTTQPRHKSDNVMFDLPHLAHEEPESVSAKEAAIHLGWSLLATLLDRIFLILFLFTTFLLCLILSINAMKDDPTSLYPP